MKEKTEKHRSVNSSLVFLASDQPSELLLILFDEIFDL